jgi:hypothetical protein
MDASKTCTATFNIQTYTLNVNKAGTGGGTVTSSPSGINCGADCSEDYTADTVVTLTAVPAGDSTFAGWSGDADCSDGEVTMDSNKTCTATFNVIQYVLTTSINPPGNGTIVPDCSGGCSYDSGTVVVLTANEDYGYPFASWTGCDSPSNNICTMTMNANKNLTAGYDSCKYPVRINGGTPVYYSSLQAAYDAAGVSDTIQSRDVLLSGDLNVDRDIPVILEGGYNCDYTAVSGNTTVLGIVTISDGQIEIGNVVVEN